MNNGTPVIDDRMETGRTPRSQWRIAQVTHNHRETSSARTIGLLVPGWSGHLAGQHIDLKLTAADGYSAQRSYSLSRPADRERIELTVQQIPDGEVSPYLAGTAIGDELEVRGPFGGWFVWHPDQTRQVLLVGGGSGIVPLMAMLRQRALADVGSDFRLVYVARSAADMYYLQELDRLGRECRWLQIAFIYTRSAPPDTERPPGRITPEDLTVPGWMPGAEVQIYVCGPTGFVESVTSMLVDKGHRPSTIRTERFGPSA